MQGPYEVGREIPAVFLPSLCAYLSELRETLAVFVFKNLMRMLAGVTLRWYKSYISILYFYLVQIKIISYLYPIKKYIMIQFSLLPVLGLACCCKIWSMIQEV